MCGDINCRHDKFNPNNPASLTLGDQASIWADIKATRNALEARRSFLEGLGADPATWVADRQFAKLSGLLAGLWTRFRVL